MRALGPGSARPLIAHECCLVTEAMWIPKPSGYDSRVVTEAIWLGKSSGSKSRLVVCVFLPLCYETVEHLTLLCKCRSKKRCTRMLGCSCLCPCVPVLFGTSSYGSFTEGV